MPAADQVEFDGGRVTVRSADSDSVVRFLLTNPGAHDLEVVANNLEEAFVALTADEAGPATAPTAMEGDRI
jgi:ABC-2 type transport system ATP-binding protein